MYDSNPDVSERKVAPSNTITFKTLGEYKALLMVAATIQIRMQDISREYTFILSLAF